MVSDWLNTSKIIDQKAKKPCHRLGLCPYGKVVEEFTIGDKDNELTCNVFHHHCPIFYLVEISSEKYNQEDYEKEIEELFDKGGLSKVFSKDKISEYWYQVGSDHSDDDNRLKLEYAIEKILEDYPDQKSDLTELHRIVEEVSLDKIYSWNSQK